MKITRRQLRQIIKEESESLDSSQELERESTVLKIMEIMKRNNLSGEHGLFSDVDNKDEFEDLVRYIFEQVGFDNKMLGSIAISIAKDFLERPDDAAMMSKFNL